MTEPNTILYDQDEISISELLVKLWAKRGLIVFLPLVLAGLTIVWLLASKTSQQGVLSYYVELNGIAISNIISDVDVDADADADSDSEMVVRYPNGVVFSPQDLLNPAVMADLAEQYSLSASALAAHIDVQFGNQLSTGVPLEYEAALEANQKADALTIAAINDRYQRKITATAKRGLKISVDFVALELTREIGEQLAIALPKTWNRIFTTQFKTRFTPKIITQKLPRYELDITSTVGFLAAENELKLVEKGAEALVKDGRLAGLTDKTGFTAGDLLRYIGDFRSIYFDPLYLNAFAQGSQLSALYLRDLQLEIDELSEEMEELNSRLNDLIQYQRGGGTITGPTGTTAGGTTQVDLSGLTAVVSLAEKAALSGYLKKTLDQRSTISKKRSAYQKRMRRISNASASVGTSESIMSQEFVQIAVERYGDVLIGYNQLIGSARDMLIKQTPSYFSVLTQPATSGKWLEVRDCLFIGLALALGGMLAIIAALVWPQREE
ncbi:MAG: hypothetical protein P8M13_09135 [Luminiphilus sp.]|nr:hypothetical protein [Luminiphilus sp.]